MKSAAKYNCPICSVPLLPVNNSLACCNNHVFDLAKEGYVNLLPVQLKKSLQPGDDKNMVVARREFLQLGHYDFLRQVLVAKIAEVDHSRIIDLGCGEGYYTNFIQQQFPNSEVYGADISKSAVKFAAKRNKQVFYAVATNAHLPMANNYLDVIVNVFAPLVGIECQRILAANGLIISVAPGEKHLFELKQHIYDKVELHRAATPPEGFQLSETQTIERVILLQEQKQVLNLLAMTPFGWKIRPEKQQRLLASLPLSVTLSFDINKFELR